jgi:ribosomal protein S18 acetylase RimI-like enzyme
MVLGASRQMTTQCARKVPGPGLSVWRMSARSPSTGTSAGRQRTGLSVSTHQWRSQTGRSGTRSGHERAGESVRMGVVEIRPARTEDAREIAVVHVCSWQSAYRGLLPQEYLDSLDPSQRVGRWERSLSETDWSRAGTLVADTGGKLLGFVGYSPARDTDADQARVGEIRAIYLVPGAWRKGIGKELMAAAVGRLIEAGFEQATLWVLHSNVRARRFYEAAGWSADGAVKQAGRNGFAMTEVRYRRALT